MRVALLFRFRGQGQGWGHFFALRIQPILYLISIYRRCFCQGVWPVRAVQRAAGATATGPWTAVCVRSMSFSIHFYQTRPHRHACANRQRRNRSGLASQRVAAPPAPSPRASNRRTLHTTHNSTAWRLRRHHCRQSSLRRKSVWALPLRRAQSDRLAVAPHGTHAVRQRAARQQLWPVARRVTP